VERGLRCNRDSTHSAASCSVAATLQIVGAANPGSTPGQGLTRLRSCLLLGGETVRMAHLDYAGRQRRGYKT
jgi:hypothetical protein